MRGGDIRAVWVVAAAVAMVTVPMATAAPGITEDPIETPLASVPFLGSEDGIEVAQEGLMASDPGPATDRKLQQAHANLDAAEDVLSVLEDEPEDQLGRTIQIAERMTRWQALTLAQEPATRPQRPSMPPSQALDELLDRHDVEPSQDQRDAIETLDALPAPVARSLADAISAQLAVETATDRMLAQAPLETLDAPVPRSPARLNGELASHELEIAADTTPLEDVPVAPVLGARLAFLDAVATLKAAIEEHPVEQGLPGATLSIPPVFALDLTGQDSTYTENVALLIDAGGDDVYRNNAGGNNLDGAGFPELRNLEDLASGTDAAALADLGGEDRYVPDVAGFGVNGGALVGSGLLLDLAGEDHYEAAGFGANGGAGLLGLGAVLDGGGADTYDVFCCAANGGAFESGVGLLIDLAGRDRYLGGNVGVNGGAVTGGVAGLVDGEGDDLYQAGATYGAWGSNAGARTSARTLMVDGAGDDTYTSGGPLASGQPGGGNGGAIGGAIATLVDAAGNDAYRSSGPGQNGGAVTSSLALLVDGSGDDFYEADQRPGLAFDRGGTNGGASRAGHGHLVDVSGNDVYRSEGRATNGGVQFTGTGLLLDGRGTDAYGPPETAAADQTIVPKGVAGAQIDLPHLPGGLPAS